MSKFIKYLFVLVVSIFTVSVINAEEVNLYVFYQDDCEYCTNLNTFLDNLELNEEVNSKYNLIKLNIDENEENLTLLNDVAEYFDYTLKGVPFYVVGNEYNSGYTEGTTDNEIISMINTEYDNEDYEDIVNKVKTGEEEVVEEEDIKSVNKIVYVLIGIAIILAIAVVFGRNEEVEDDTELPKLKKTEKNNKNINLNNDTTFKLYMPDNEVKKDINNINKDDNKNKVVKTKKKSNNKKKKNKKKK